MASEKLYRTAKLETQAIAIKVPAEKFYEMYTCTPHHVSRGSPQIVRKIELLEGQWGEVGNVSSWEYVLDGKRGMLKSILETIDYDKKISSHKVVEGDLLKYYKSFRFHMHVFSKDEGSFVLWTLDYEKVNEAVPDPEPMIFCLIQYTKDIDAYLSKIAKA